MEEKPKEQKPKSDKPKNDRFNMEKLMVEEENQRNNQMNEQRNELRNNYSQNIPIIQSSVPIVIHNPEPNMIPIIKENDFPDLKSISQNKVIKNTNSNTNSFSYFYTYQYPSSVVSAGANANSFLAGFSYFQTVEIEAYTIKIILYYECNSNQKNRNNTINYFKN